MQILKMIANIYNIPKMRVVSKFLADTGSAVKIINIGSQEQSPKTRVEPKVLTNIGLVVEIVSVAPQEFTEGVLPEAFIFCLNIGTVKVENLSEQGIFASVMEMSSMMGTRNSMPVFFTTIWLNDEEINNPRS